MVAATALFLAACWGRQAGTNHNPDRTDTHTTALDHTGTYTGVLPAADCPGIEVELTLGDNGTYFLKQRYIDRDTDFRSDGRYTVAGDLLTLDAADGATYYKVEKNRLLMLDAERQPVDGAMANYYVLTKTNPE